MGYTVKSVFKHMSMASYNSDSQRHHNTDLGYLVLWLWWLMIFMFQLLNYWSAELIENSWAPRKLRSKLGVDKRIYFGYYGYIMDTYPLAPWPVFTQSIISWWDIVSEAKAALSLRIFQERHPTQCPGGGFLQQALRSFLWLLGNQGREEEEDARAWRHLKKHSL